MKIPTFQVTTFSSRLYSGNSASVCLLDSYLPDNILLKISQENLTPETAFVVKDHSGIRIRWFSSVQEVEICGHGSIAAAHVLKKHLGEDSPQIPLIYKGGTLIVECKSDDRYSIGLKGRDPVKTHLTKEALEAVFKTQLQDFFVTTSIVCIVDSVAKVLNSSPDQVELGQFGYRSCILSSQGNDCDYILRYFTPYESHYEDPATGVAQASLAPYWSEKLKKNKLIVKQVSNRQGFMECRVLDDLVEITGSALTYFSGHIFI